MTLQTIATLLMQGNINHETSGFAETYDGQDLLDFYRSVVGERYFSCYLEDRHFCDKFHFLWTTEPVNGERLYNKASFEDGTPVYFYFIDGWDD